MTGVKEAALLECDLVGNLTFSQKGPPHTHQSVLEISRNTGICRSSVDRIIRDGLFRATNPEENNMAVSKLMYNPEENDMAVSKLMYNPEENNMPVSKLMYNPEENNMPIRKLMYCRVV